MDLSALRRAARKERKQEAKEEKQADKHRRKDERRAAMQRDLDAGRNPLPGTTLTGKPKCPYCGAGMNYDGLFSLRSTAVCQKCGRNVREPTPARDDNLDRLTQLADLHERGALTDAEFAEQKARLLD